MRPIARQFPIALLLTLLLLSACLGGGKNNQAPGDAALLENGAATLTCSQACADQAQCGESSDRGQVVLLNADGPATRNHSLAVPVNTGVNIQLAQPWPARRVATGEDIQVTFYLVDIPERTTMAWVAGWCIQGTAAPTTAP